VKDVDSSDSYVRTKLNKMWSFSQTLKMDGHAVSFLLSNIEQGLHMNSVIKCFYWILCWLLVCLLEISHQ